jgi:hypothetical protein
MEEEKRVQREGRLIFLTDWDGNDLTLTKNKIIIIKIIIIIINPSCTGGMADHAVVLTAG